MLYNDRMKDTTKMKGQVIGHFGDEIKVGPTTEGVLYPGFELFVKGYRTVTEPNAGEQTSYYELFFFVDRDSGLDIALSAGKGFGEPLEFNFLDKRFSILAQKTDEPDVVIINLKLL